MIPNIILICVIIYNLQIFQSAKKAKLFKMNLPINYHDFLKKEKKTKLNILHIFWPTKSNSNKYKIGQIMISYSHMTLALYDPRHVGSA